jgi:hypothetical protein
VKTTSVVIAFASVVFVATAWAQMNNSADGQTKLAGAWEMTSYDYGNSGGLPKGSKEVKLLSANHFVWVLYNAKNGQTLATGGGTYTLTGDSYTEHLDYSDKRAAALIGKDQRFTLKLSGDTLQTMGTLSTGQRIAETWNRMERGRTSAASDN